MAGEVKVGTYTGTGAAINIQCGFIPDHVQVINLTDGDNKWSWFAAMTDGHAIFERAVVDSGSTGNASMAPITSNGISEYAGSTSAGKGFTVGSALSESGKVFGYIATRNTP